MAAKFIKVEPFDLVVFGGTGDLAYRKLYPALLHRDKSEQFIDPTRIIGVWRRPLERDAFRASVRDSLIKFNGYESVPDEVIERFLDGSTIRGRRGERGRLDGSQIAARSRRPDARLLHGDRAGFVWTDRQTARAAGSRRCARA